MDDFPSNYFKIPVSTFFVFHDFNTLMRVYLVNDPLKGIHDLFLFLQCVLIFHHMMEILQNFADLSSVLDFIDFELGRPIHICLFYH